LPAPHLNPKPRNTQHPTPCWRRLPAARRIVLSSDAQFPNIQGTTLYTTSRHPIKAHHSNPQNAICNKSITHLCWRLTDWEPHLDGQPAACQPELVHCHPGRCNVLETSAHYDDALSLVQHNVMWKKQHVAETPSISHPIFRALDASAAAALRHFCEQRRSAAHAHVLLPEETVIKAARKSSCTKKNNSCSLSTM